MENQINFPGSLETKNYLSKTLFFTFPSNKFYQIFTKFGKRSLLSDKCHHPWMHWTTAARIRLGRHQPKAMLQNDIWFHMWKGVIHSATAFSCNWVSKNVLFIAFHTSKGKKRSFFTSTSHSARKRSAATTDIVLRVLKSVSEYWMKLLIWECLYSLWPNLSGGLFDYTKSSSTCDRPCQMSRKKHL